MKVAYTVVYILMVSVIVILSFVLGFLFTFAMF